MDYSRRDEAPGQQDQAASVPGSARAGRTRHPAVSAETAEVFGRPDGVNGSFVRSGPRHEARQPEVAAPDPVLAEAFGRPEGVTETLQRDPLATYGHDDVEPSPPDPWRDPESAVHLGSPAQESHAAGPYPPGPKIGVRELLLGRRVSWVALATLAIIALLIGVLGGLMGRFTAEVAAPLHTDSVRLSPGDSRGDDPRSNIVEVARAVENSVVAIQIRFASGVAIGSGFIIDENGYILTNNHVITAAANDSSAILEVIFNDRSRVPARIVGRDTKTDLAVLKVDDVANLTVSNLGNSDDLQIGEEVIAFGSPLGLDRTVTSGIVSAVNRPVPLRPDAESDTDAVINAVQTDAAVNSGNSGGPLVNSAGEVIGINTAGAGVAGSIGLSFAIPISEAIPVAQALIRDGSVSHPVIGINASSVRNDRVLGAGVRNVTGDGPAAAAGIRERDVILEFNGRRIESADELTVAERTATIGDEVAVKYWRDGRTFDTTITPVSD